MPPEVAEANLVLERHWESLIVGVLYIVLEGLREALDDAVVHPLNECVSEGEALKETREVAEIEEHTECVLLANALNENDPLVVALGWKDGEADFVPAGSMHTKLALPANAHDHVCAHSSSAVLISGMQAKDWRWGQLLRSAKHEAGSLYTHSKWPGVAVGYAEAVPDTVSAGAYVVKGAMVARGFAEALGEMVDVRVPVRERERGGGGGERARVCKWSVRARAKDAWILLAPA